MHLLDTGLAFLDSASLRNHVIQIVKFVMAVAATIVTVVAGNWPQDLVKSARLHDAIWSFNADVNWANLISVITIRYRNMERIQ